MCGEDPNRAMKLIFCGDPHFRAKGSRYRVDDYYRVQFDKLNQILQLGEQHQASGVVFLGDVFHSVREPHELVKDLLGTFKKYTVPTYAIVGNHDLIGYNADSIGTSPLGVLVEAGALKLLGKSTEFSDNVVVRGVDYRPDHALDQYILEDSSKFKIVATHNMIIPMEKAPFAFVHPDHVSTDANLMVCGHYHMPFDYVSSLPGMRRTLNPGVPMRWTVNEAVIQPKVALLDVSYLDGVHSYKVTYIPLVAKPGSEVLNLKEASTTKSSSQAVENFIDQLQSTQFNSCNMEETLIQYGKENDISKAVIDELLHRIQTQRA